MKTLGHHIHGPVLERAQSWTHRQLVADGLLIGGIAGLVNLAAIHIGPWWLVELTGFLTAPVLLATSLVNAPGELVAAITLVMGSMLLYGAYTALLVFSKSEQARAVWIVLVMLVHTACLIAWIGLYLSRVVATALAF